MAKKVTSFSELFQTSPLESDFFEGLDELIPPSMLHNIDASMSIVPQPQPEPQPEPQAPVQAVDPPIPPILLEVGPSQRRVPRRAPGRRYTRAQRNALETFVAVNPHPTREEKEVLSVQTGLHIRKISQWIHRYWNRSYANQSAQSENVELKRKVEELLKENEELQVKNRFLTDTLQSTSCSQCRGPVLHPDVQRSGKRSYFLSSGASSSLIRGSN